MKRIIGFLTAGIMTLSIASVYPFTVSAKDHSEVKTHATGCLDPQMKQDFILDEKYDLYEGCEDNSVEITAENASIPSSFDISTNSSTAKFFPPIGNQGDIGSCTAWATTYYQFTYEVNKLRNITTTASNSYSPTWTYNYINGGVDKGGYLANAYWVLKNQGAMTMADLPYYGDVEDYSFAWPRNIQKMLDALHYRASSTHKYVSSTTSSNFTLLKQQIANGHVVVMNTDTSGWTITENASGQSVVVRAADGSSGHALAIVGYDDNFRVTVNGTELTGALKVANSWGADWENNGYIWIAYDAINSTSKYSTGWDSGYEGERCSVLGDGYINYITPYYCEAAFCERVVFRTRDLWNISMYGGRSDATLTTKWSSIPRFSTWNSSGIFGVLVFDFTQPNYSIDLNNCLSSQWKLRMTGSSKEGSTYAITTCLVDCQNNAIEQFDNIAYSMTGGEFIRTHSASIAIGRISSYDSLDITIDDVSLLQNYLLGDETLSSLQYMLADYNSNGKVDGIDLALMRQHIAAANGQTKSLEVCIVELQESLCNELTACDISFAEFMSGELASVPDVAS